jgi:glycosyltransferase involved in cell wall biosynthesis
MRILMINYEYPPVGGGTANANYYFIKELAKDLDVVVDLITVKPNPGILIEDFSNNIHLHKIGIHKKDLHHWTGLEMLEWCLGACFYIKHLLKKNTYDICHCWNGWPPGFLGYLFRKKVPYVVALRGNDVPGYEVRFRFLEKIIVKDLCRTIWTHASMITANSEELAKLAQNTLRCKIAVIPNGVDTDDFYSKKHEEIRMPLTLISTNRLGQRKGHIYLIQALRKIKGYRLILVGQGSEMENLKRESRGLDVEFRGYVGHADLNKELHRADIYISTSLVEGMSNSTLEAMAAGLPIISTNVGGIGKMIDGNGVVIKKTADADMIAEALDYYLKNPSLIPQHGKRSRQMAEEMNWEFVVERYRREVYGASS